MQGITRRAIPSMSAIAPHAAPPASGTVVEVLQLYLRFCLVYLLLALVIAHFYLPSGQSMLVSFYASLLILEGIGRTYLLGVAAGLALLVVLVGPREFLARIHAAGLALLAAIALSTGYMLIKNALPYLTPYFADALLADIDSRLHFGISPWKLTHALGDGEMSVGLLETVYLVIWSFPAMTLPIILALTDRDAARVRRTLILYAAAWILIGNVLALAGLSVGPVYYDRLLGGTRFADLVAALQQSGVTTSSFGIIQERLWEVYRQSAVVIGSGISAFPSVHVAVATVTVIYLAERSRRWLIPGIPFLALILFTSVYTGYHYAIDGYASILIVLMLWWLLRRRESKPG